MSQQQPPPSSGWGALAVAGSIGLLVVIGAVIGAWEASAQGFREGGWADFLGPIAVAVAIWFAIHVVVTTIGRIVVKVFKPDRS